MTSYWSDRGTGGHHGARLEAGTMLGPHALATRLEDLLIRRPASDGAVRVERWLTLDTRTETDGLAYAFVDAMSSDERARLVAMLRTLADPGHAHLLTFDRIEAAAGVPVATGPYCGHQDGLLTLPMLIEQKGGQLSPAEAERAVVQLLEAYVHAAELGIHHGPLDPSQVLIDRRGSVAIELFGAGRALDGLNRWSAELVRDEVRSVAELAYRMLTGIEASEPMLRPSRLAKRAEKAWDAWCERGLDAAGGFDTPLEALAALPSGVFADAASGPERAAEADSGSAGLGSGLGSGGVIGRLRDAVRTRRGAARRR